MSQDLSLDVRTSFPVDDTALSRVHALAFGSAPGAVEPWARRLERNSVAWVGAFASDLLVGFVHACGDGGKHAFLLDTVVDPDYRRRGVGRLLVLTLIAEVRAAGCEWLHVDYQPHLDSFYRNACGFRATTAGLIRLAG